MQNTAARTQWRGGYLKDFNCLREHAKELGLSRGELAVIHAIRHFQEQPQFGYCVPSVKALAPIAGYTREYTSTLLHALMRPKFDESGQLLRTGYITKVLRPGRKPWYDLRRLVREANKFEQPEQEARQKPDYITPQVDQIFAGWAEIDGSPGKTLQRIHQAEALAGWSERELRTAMAIAADKTTRARPQRHIALFLSILEQNAKETAQRRAVQRDLLRQARENTRYWVEQDRQRLKEQRRAARAMLPASKSSVAPIAETPDPMELKRARLHKVQHILASMATAPPFVLRGSVYRGFQEEARALAAELGGSPDG